MAGGARERVNVLSIQSWVAYGHVGNAAAIFPLQRLGAEVWAVHTVQFSNHTGYEQWTGEVFSAASIRALVDGIAARGVLPACDALLSGYLGDAAIGEAIVDAAARVRAANPAALWCCDPVIGDIEEGVYVRPGIADFLRTRALPAADILTPNHFELELLAATPCATFAEVRRALDRLHAAGPRTILVTSLRTEATPADAIDLLVSEAGRAHLLRTPRLPIYLNGTGDAIAALFLFHRLRSGDARTGLEAAASALHGVLRATLDAGARELALIAAQDEIVNPSLRFTAVPV